MNVPHIVLLASANVLSLSFSIHRSAGAPGTASCESVLLKPAVVRHTCDECTVRIVALRTIWVSAAAGNPVMGNQAGDGTSRA